jgi:hypothetical protein
MEKPPAPKPSPALTDSDFQLRLFRERMAAGIALVIVIASFVMIGATMTLVGSPEQFSLAKDLLLFVNPILGVAVGYFFNKVTSDARAETAEKAADVASVTAQQATEARNQVLAENETMRTEKVNMEGVLHDLVLCSEEMMAQTEPPKTPRNLSAERGSESPAVSVEALLTRAALEAAVNRAQKWMSR